MALAGVGEALASVVLKEVSRKLGSAIGEQIKARWNLEQDMEDIRSTLGIVQAVLRDAERRSIREEAVNLWLKRLKDAAYDISDMFDEFEVKLTKGKIASSVAKLTMGKKLKNIREKLAKIAAQHTQFAFNYACSTQHEEIKKRQTTSTIDRATVVGRQKEKDDIVNLLKSTKEQETVVIPIFGFGGIGKTTLARLVFNDDLMQDFDLRLWVYVSPYLDLEMIGKSIISQINQRVEGFVGLQSIKNCLEETLGGRSCLIVLDDVWETKCSQLDELMLMLSKFKEKSKIRIIVTTRTEEVARNIGTVTPYKLKPLSDDHCWTLFKKIAFQSCFSSREDKNVLDEIGRDIAKKCQGVPMAVQALGFMLRNKNVDEWKNVRDSDVWDGSSTTDMLPSLKLSYYQMTDYLKLCFSYCSVFPKGCEIHRGDLIQQWISLGFIPSIPGEQHLTLEKIGENYVNELLGMSFLQYSRLTSSITREDTTNSMLLSMHDLIHDLARSVLGDELVFVDGKRGYDSRSGNHRYALVVNGAREIYFCNYVPIKLRSLHILDSGEIHPSLYSKSLRVLDVSKFSSGNFPASIGKLNQLRYLRARGMQNKSVPKSVTSLSKLMYLDISGSSEISTLPKSVNNLRSLVHLDLSGCCNLCSLPESFGDLEKVSHLNLANCSLLKALPESVNKLRSLLHLDLSGCCNICSLPESFGDLENVSHLNLANCSLLKALPESVNKLRRLLHLNLSGCCNLCSLPESFGDLENVSHLNLTHCSLLKALPESVNKLRSLLHLDLSGCCNLCSLPESFGDLTNLTDLDLGSCVLLNILPDSVNKLRNLFRLDLSGCCNLCSLPESSGDLMNLSHLYLANCSLLKTLPESVHKLKSLLHLDLSGCSSLHSLPESFGELINLLHLNLAKCTDLRSLPKSFGRLCELQYLNLSDCLRLNLWFDIETVCCLTKLQYLNLSRCPSLMHIPESVNNLKDLHTLDLSRCHWIQIFPESLCGMASLKFLLIHECRPWLQQRVRESQFKDDDVITLPKFIVQRTASGMSSNISRLQSVYPAELEIVCLETVASIEEANAVNLADKSVLAKLVLAWTPAVERFVEDEALLRELQPPENLMFLKVQGYKATSFPGWVMGIESCLLHLVCIEMVDLPRCEHLPPFGQLKNLQKLILKGMPILKKLGTEICGGSGAFTELKELTLENLDILEEWVTKIPANGEFMFPSLHKLEICHCPKLRLTPCLPRALEWRIEASDEIIASQYDAGSSSSFTLSKLHVTSCQVQPNQWALLGFLPALEVLEISNYGEEKLPDSTGLLVSLRSLKIDVSTQDPEKQSDLFLFLISTIFGDLELAFLPKPRLTALENLEISFADKLQTWCSRKHGTWTMQKANNELAAFFERMLASINWPKDEGLSYIHQVKELAYALNAIGQNLCVRDEEIIRRIRKLSLTSSGGATCMQITSGWSVSSYEVSTSSEEVPPTPHRKPPSPSRFAPSPQIPRVGSVDLGIQQILRATQNFSPSFKLGDGGFGMVYRAVLTDGNVVAVKRAKKDQFAGPRDEFSNEVDLLAKIDHRNLVRLLGFTDKGNERIIITEYVPNGTLREHLDGQHGRILDFNQRLEIAIDVAHALTYLHLYAEKTIIHRDVKSSNILLTDSYRAKVSDFGFAQSGPSDTEKTHILTKVRGTAGYLDPEYLRTYQLTPKSDVFSFGILLVEILSARRPIELKGPNDKRITIRWTFKKFNEGNMRDILDPLLEDHVDDEVLEKLLSLAFQCAAPTRDDRPTMEEVGEQLWEIRKEYGKSIGKQLLTCLNRD